MLHNIPSWNSTEQWTMDKFHEITFLSIDIPWFFQSPWNHNFFICLSIHIPWNHRCHELKTRFQQRQNHLLQNDKVKATACHPAEEFPHFFMGVSCDFRGFNGGFTQLDNEMWLGKSANTMEVVASWENRQTVAVGFSSLPRLIKGKQWCLTTLEGNSKQLSERVVWHLKRMVLLLKRIVQVFFSSSRNFPKESWNPCWLMSILKWCWIIGFQKPETIILFVLYSYSHPSI